MLFIFQPTVGPRRPKRAQIQSDGRPCYDKITLKFKMRHDNTQKDALRDADFLFDFKDCQPSTFKMTVDEAADIRKCLTFADEELKGKLQPAELVVDHSTLVETAKVHTSTLLLFNDKIEQLQSSVDEIRKTLSTRIDEIDAKNDRWCAGVEALERRADVSD